MFNTHFFPPEKRAAYDTIDALLRFNYKNVYSAYLVEF